MQQKHYDLENKSYGKVSQLMSISIPKMLYGSALIQTKFFNMPPEQCCCPFFFAKCVTAQNGCNFESTWIKVPIPSLSAVRNS